MRERGYVVEPPAMITVNPIPRLKLVLLLLFLKNKSHPQKTKFWQAEPAVAIHIATMFNPNTSSYVKGNKEHREQERSRQQL